MAGKGVGKRTVAVALAVVLAGVAALALMSYVRGVEARAIEDQEPVQAFVAKDVIPAGKFGEVAVSEGLIVRVPVPRKVVPEGAVTSLTQINRKVAAVSILKGEQILAARFVEPAEARGLLPIPADRQAVSIEVGVPSGVAGFIQGGDRVSMVAQIDVQSGGQAESRVQYLLQNIQVLSVGHRVVTTETKEGESQVQQQQGRVLLTLALTPEEAERVVLAHFQGQVYFTLLPPGQEPFSTPGRTRGNVFG